MSDYRLSLLADDDLLDIFRYTTRTWGPEQVPVYLAILEASKEKIIEDPFLIGSKARNDLADGCRIYRIEKHYFVYRISEGTVEIGRVLHQAMDFEQQVNDSVFE